jgi:serine/threonine-protein kinase
MSPEQCAGDAEIDGRSDVYSLGVVGYQLVSGDLPFVAANTPAMLVKHLSETPRPLIERVLIPQTLNDAIMRCLAKDPADRFATAFDLVAALSGKPVPPPPRHATTRTYGFGASEVGTTVAPAANVPPHVPARDAAYDAAYAAPHALAAPVPTPADVARWEASPVRRFRNRLVGYLVFNGAFIPLGLIGNYESLVATVATVWGIVLARGYVKLWNRGYDWRDVLRRSRDTLFVDVVGETVESTRAFFDPNKRHVVRERMRARLRQQPGLFTPSPAEGGAAEPRANAPPASVPPYRDPTMPAITGVQAPLTLEGASQYPSVQRASAARAEIRRIYSGLPESDRQLLPDVNASADALYIRIEMLAVRVDELERADVPGMGDAIEREITELERESNPFDGERSERRVRRLAQLKRQRISLRDLQERRHVATQKLERCVTALQSMQLDLVRLTTGTRSHESITQLAEQAVRLGGEVDAVLYANDEIARILR